MLWRGSRAEAARVLQRNPRMALLPELSRLPAGHAEGWSDALTSVIRGFYDQVRDPSGRRPQAARIRALSPLARRRGAAMRRPAARYRQGRHPARGLTQACERLPLGQAALVDHGAHARLELGAREELLAQLLTLLLSLAPRPVSAISDEALLRRGDVDALVGSPARTRRDLGWRARVGFADSVRAMWDSSAAS